MSDRARALLDGASDRAACKRLGAVLDQGGADLKAEVAAVARARGVELPEDALDWPGKKLLRWARDRAAASQIRRNPIRRDEGFTCVACGAEVPPHGRSARDHCPHCLRGLHVDGEVPGDRAAACGGVLEPVAITREGGRWVLRYRCARCGAERRNQVLEDGDPPDDWAKVVALTARA